MTRKVVLCLVSGMAVFLAACGSGGGNSGGGGGNQTLTTPTVTVTAATNSISVAQSLAITVSVSGSSGTPTGSVTLTAGHYTSSAATLNNGSASITVPAGALTTGSITFTSMYSPDSASSSKYNSASGTALVSVTVATPTLTVTPAFTSVGTGQSLSVSVTVAGFAGGPIPTGSLILTTGSYTSAAATLTNGSAAIVIPAGTLAIGTAKLTASYSPDTAGAAIYASASGSATVTVTSKITPTVTVTPASTSINTAQSLDVTVSVAGPPPGAPTATGAVSLSGGGYTSPSPVALTNGSTTITIAAGALASGNVTLTATYTPDAASSSYYNGSSGTSAALSVVPMSTITVNQSTTLAPVTDQLLGMNLESWYDVVGNATAINAAFANAGIKAIRWPGGSWSDDYHWNPGGTANSLTQMCNTTKTPPLQWGGYSSFSQFASSIPKAGGFDLALTANYGSDITCTKGGDPSEAAAWAAGALSYGTPASHMTVGNENYGIWEEDLHPIKHDPTTYANSVIGSSGYYQMIKAASPSTKVGVVVDANCTTSSGCTNGWDTTVLSLAKGSYDFVEYHFYPQYNAVTSDTYLVHQAAQDFTTSINIVKSELITAGEANTPIYVGEVGGNSANPGTQSWSITQGLYAGQLLGEAMNNGVSRLTWWDGFGNCFGPGNNSPLLYGWQDWGAQSVFSDGPSETNCPNAGPLGTLSPTARAFQLFSNVALNNESALSTSVTGDQNNIRAYAATHSGGTALLVFNLNQNQSQPVTISLPQQNGSTVSDVIVITYDKKIYDYTDPTCKTDPGCTYDPTHDYTSGVWAPPSTKDYGAEAMPLTLTLTPWSMNVVIIQ